MIDPPTDPLTVNVPMKTLLEIRRLCRAGQSPKICWSEAKQRMDEAAMQARGEALAAIEEALEIYLHDR